MSAFDKVIRSSFVIGSLEKFGVFVCHFIESHNTTVCPEAVKEMGDIMIPMLTNLILSPTYACGKGLNLCTDVKYVELKASDYVARVLSTKPDFLKDNNYLNSLYK